MECDFKTLYEKFMAHNKDVFATLSNEDEERLKDTMEKTYMVLLKDSLVDEFRQMVLKKMEEGQLVRKW